MRTLFEQQKSVTNIPVDFILNGLRHWAIRIGRAETSPRQIRLGRWRRKPNRVKMNWAEERKS
jgi:hypothetical protein